MTFIISWEGGSAWLWFGPNLTPLVKERSFNKDFMSFFVHDTSVYSWLCMIVPLLNTPRTIRTWGEVPCYFNTRALSVCNPWFLMPPTDLTLYFEGKKNPKWLFIICQSLNILCASFYLILKAIHWGRKCSHPHFKYL